MFIRIFASLAVAALLVTGVFAAPASPEYGRQPKAAQTLPLEASQAETIALDDAGLSANEVQLEPTRYEVDGGVPVWEVEFRAGDREYDFTIHAETGRILEKDIDKKPAKTPTDPTAEQTLTAAEAKETALAHAGLSADRVRGLEAELDREKGKLIWEVEFRSGRTEYDCEIDALTGRILWFESEIDD